MIQRNSLRTVLKEAYLDLGQIPMIEFLSKIAQTPMKTVIGFLQKKFHHRCLTEP